METYRKLYEPEYGSVAPEVRIGKPQEMDMQNPGKWRAKSNRETILEIEREISKCSCFKHLMTVRTRDQILHKNGREIPVRIYDPGVKRKVPIMLFYHGGAFMMNNIEVYDRAVRYLSRYGNMVVISVDYRLAPEFPFPCGLEDAYDALEWSAVHASELGGSRENIVVCGDSSGGNFATVVSMMTRDRKGPDIRKQVLIYPLITAVKSYPTESEIRYGKGHFLEYDKIEDTVEAYLGGKGERDNPYVSPLFAENLKELPPAGLYAAECDPLLDQGLMYAARLEDAGVIVEHHIYKGMIHAFLNATYGKTFEMMNEICEYVNRN